MPIVSSFDPDQFLDLSRTEPISREEGLIAWEKAYAALGQRLSELGARAELYVVFGLQASGKSSWVNQRLAQTCESTLFFSGPLPSRCHRQRVLALAKGFGCRVIGIWVKVPLHVALQRNAERQGAARVPEHVIQHVYESLEPPALEEGFDEVLHFEWPHIESISSDCNGRR